ncbi:putative autoinducer 2 transporter [Campylobacter iguaniorum]|uniref:Putative autoinducer 2 transporter n=1 Tax=Campylobacter iguaniorum TaxID=1244531 RepID=A0A076FAX1_9BACT|nr:AI-2E family transporter [Campylobacter iguaniorum]AII15370.1 putative autoinducer 2 transporter [Campylobacter iguaniorum]ALV25300.1 putative autoinducer 2 transporter [Campylobacter iguaniorum]
MKYQLMLISVASFVIIAAGLSAASAIMVPFLLAVFIAIVVSPVLGFMERLKVRKSLAFIMLISAFILVLWFLGSVVSVALNGFSASLPEYQAQLKAFMDEAVAWLNSYEIIKINSFVIDSIDTNKIFATTSTVLRQTSEIVTKSFLVFLLVIFMLVETQVFKDKVEYFSKKHNSAHDIVNNFISNLKRYLAIKTVSSIATGLILWGVLVYFGVPYAPLWAVVAFILNYIPTIGSIIAAIPALLMALIANDLSTVVWLSAIYLIVNIAIGNFIEPKFLGSGLGISTLVVILSLLFWGFLLGIGGMFLAVPLTMSIKIALNENPKTKFLAILLSNKAD